MIIVLLAVSVTLVPKAETGLVCLFGNLPQLHEKEKLQMA